LEGVGVLSEPVTIRHMTKGDIAFAMSLKELAGWNQLRLDWERLLEFEPEGCLLAEAMGRPAGTATTIAYGGLFGWVGMVLVHPDLRRQGIGRSLLMAGIAHLEALGLKAVKLDATPMGKRLYDTIGFVDEYPVERWAGWGGGAPTPPSGLRELTPDDLELVATFDKPLFGADRGRVLRRMLCETTVRVAGCFGSAGDLQAYAAVRPGQNAAYIGPWVASNAGAARIVWDWSLGLVGFCPVFVDVVGPNRTAREFVAASGFVKQRDLIRMYRGTNVSPGHPESQYGLCGLETG
jgi:GNAT superfamily N-acetyltransferase